MSSAFPLGTIACGGASDGTVETTMFGSEAIDGERSSIASSILGDEPRVDVIAPPEAGDAPRVDDGTATSFRVDASARGASTALVPAIALSAFATELCALDSDSAKGRAHGSFAVLRTTTTHATRLATTTAVTA